jgi:hypothetical protein
MALQPGLDLLHRLVAGQRAERGDRVFARQQLAQSRSAPRRASVNSSWTTPRRRTTSSAE